MAQWVNINVIRQATTSQLCWDRIDSIAYCRLPIHDLWIGSQQRPRSKRRPWLEVNNAAAPLPRFWEQSLHGLQPAGWLWSLFCGNSLRRGRSDADDFIQPDTPWRLARENGSDATIVWNVWSAIALKLILKSQKMSFYENFVVFCSWLIHRSDKCIRISSWKGILQILQRGKKKFLNRTQQFRVWCWQHRWQEMASFLSKQLRTIAFVTSTKITLCLWLLFHPLRGWVWLNQGGKYAYSVYL